MVKDKQKRTEEMAGSGDDRPDVAAPAGEENLTAAAPPGPAAPTPSAAAPAQAAGPAAGNGQADATPIAALSEELEALRRDLQDASDRHLRLAAEFDNYRKRVERERTELWSRAQADIASRMLDTLDDLERVAHHSESATLQALHEGVQLIERKLRGVLTAAGLEEVAAENASFDPQLMEAVAVVLAERPEDDDVVSDVFQRGYRFKGQLLRAARVRVKKHD